MKIKILTIVLLLITALSSQSNAQNKNISGKVTSKEDGLPMPGVSVKVIGTTLGTQTDANGIYTIAIPLSSKSLEFSFLGFAKKSCYYWF